MTEREMLASLRRVFREELDDQLGNVTRQITVLERDASAEERQRAILEVYRAVHSLKGAARSVGYGALERPLHELEGRIGAARTGGAASPLGDGESLAVALAALSLLQRAARKLAAGAQLDEGDLADASSDDRVEADEVKPDEAAAGDTSTRTDRVRVDAADVDALARTAESLVAASTALFRGAEEVGTLERLLLDVQTDVAQALHAARAASAGQESRAAEELRRRLERVASSLRTTFGWAEARRRRDEDARRTATLHARRVAEQARALRVVDFAEFGPMLARTVREAATEAGRRVTFHLRADGVYFDRRMQEPLRQALVPLLRNAVDHGIEPPERRLAVGKPEDGFLEVAAEASAAELVVVVRDDGAGIDRTAVEAAARRRGIVPEGAELPDDADLLGLVFEAGLSTRDQASKLSGRGLGLDIVRQRVAELHGRIELASEPGRGTTFRLVLPTDLGIVRGLVVGAGRARYAFVLPSVRDVRRLRSADIVTLAGGLHWTTPAGPLPLGDLSMLLGVAPEGRGTPLDGAYCVLLGSGGRTAALLVEAPVTEEEIVLRPLGGRMRRIPFVAGVTSTEGADLTFVLHADELVRHVRPRPASNVDDVEEKRRPRILVVDDSVTTRELERSLLRAAGYEVATATNGAQAWDMLARGEAFDAILSDIDMPELDGLQLVARLRSTTRFASIPVILVTALSDDAQRQRAAELGASAYIVKGTFDQDELLETLEQLV